jgi:effector-binding domain-containing protein
MVEIVDVPSSSLAAITCRVAWAEIPGAIKRALDVVWPALRTQDVKTNHNVVVYREPGPDGVTLDIGVQVLGAFTGTDDVALIAAPAGRAAHVVHLGPYSELGKAHDAVTAYCNDNGHPPGVHWEVYGDWTDDVAQLRTDVYRKV